MRSRLENVLARRLRETAKVRGLPLSHLADRAGIARSYLWLLLDGEAAVTLTTIQRLAEVLDVEPLELLTVGAPQPTRMAAEPRAHEYGSTRKSRRRPRRQ